MARPKEFDVDVALDRAMELFWAQGFEATSVQDLVDAMSINRGSLYGTFGGKDELFAKALARYGERSGAALVDIMQDDGSLRDRLSAFLVGLVEEADGRGCFVVNSVCERSYGDPDTKQSLVASLDGTRLVLTQAIAGAAGELHPEVTPEIAVETVLTLMNGLQVLTKADADPATLRAVIDRSLDSVTP